MSCELGKMGQEEARAPTACGRRTDGGRFEDEVKEDDDDFEIVGFRETWELCYASNYGSFEDISKPSQLFILLQPDYLA